MVASEVAEPDVQTPSPVGPVLATSLPFPVEEAGGSPTANIASLLFDLNVAEIVERNDPNEEEAADSMATWTTRALIVDYPSGQSRRDEVVPADR